MRKITLVPETTLNQSGKHTFSEEEIVNAYEKGIPVKTIGKMAFRSVGDLYRILEKYNVDINRKKNARAEQKRMQVLFKQDKKKGLTVREIARKHKFTLGNVCNILYNV